MKIDVTVKKVICDSCGVKLIKRDVYTNNGAYQADYFTFGEVETCFTCAGKILDRELKNIMKDKSDLEITDELKVFINKLVKSQSRNPLGPDFEPGLYFGIAKKD